MRNYKKNKKAHNKGKLTDTKLTKIALHYEYAFEWGVNFEHRVICLTNDVDTNSFEVLDAAMTEMERNSKRNIVIKINSMGGNVYDALGIVGRIRKSPCKIIVEGYGAIMSAAIVILACGDIRRISKYAWLMHHESQYEVEGRHSVVQAEVQQKQLEESMWADTMTKFSKKSKKFWLEYGKGIDFHFSPKEAMKFGIIDEIF